MKLILKNFVSLPGAACGLFLLLFVTPAYSTVFTTVANGNFNSASTWDGNGVPNTGSDIPASDTINIRHIVFYNTGNSLKNKGTIRIQPIAGTTARLDVPTGINVENLQGGNFLIINASFLQCRFVPCNNGQPYSGNNPGAVKLSGSFKNIGGYVEVRNSTVEVAQDFTSESGGTRLIEDSCILTGQNFSVKGSGTNDTITRSFISIGWHASGNFELADGLITLIGSRFN